MTDRIDLMALLGVATLLWMTRKVWWWVLAVIGAVTAIAAVIGLIWFGNRVDEIRDELRDTRLEQRGQGQLHV